MRKILRVCILLTLSLFLIASTAFANGSNNRLISNHEEVTYSITNNVITISWGEKPTGGYSIEITDLKLDQNNNLLVYYKTESPKEGDMVTLAITYPKDSMTIPTALRGYRAVRLVSEETTEEVTYSIANNVITVHWGEKPTGGYSIKITELKLDSNNNLLVYYKTESPKDRDSVTLAITYPRDSMTIPTALRGYRVVKLVHDHRTEEITYSIENNVITISWGEKPTGGYFIEITDLKLDKNTLLVYYKTESPKAGDFVTQVITYPKDSKVIPVTLRSFNEVKLVLDVTKDKIEDKEKKNDDNHHPGKGPNIDRIVQKRIDKSIKKIEKINDRITKNDKQMEKFQEQLIKTVKKTNVTVEHFLGKLDFFADRYTKEQLVTIQDNINKRLNEVERISKFTTSEKTQLRNRPLEDRLYIRGEKLIYDVPPVTVNGRTLVPVRIISEYLGAIVEWDNKLQKVTITKNDNVIELFINNKVAWVNGKKVELDVPAYQLNGRTMVPIRFICDALGESLDYISETGDIDIGNGNLDAILLILN
ncbi:protease complex subunit PrcB family protein [Serpentinicella alkaliphila]|uniref:Copper amine oxidase-like protein n=1 Tax=Serpentinicella alkaliphila TaxID=1734049 RepID=A0A4R2TRZ9_9FIRM|nr:protease complex subunit PrcB family protein [Serpentinicella alkaliphila]QUH24469.1 protease complex subunit PrcB family protein [Serpentinicella alkaliphila]TCQ04135.1 copper amine oxidase-like protein [Serpentinicella alkaliphila]